MPRCQRQRGTRFFSPWQQMPQYDKLLFVSARYKFPVIANQRARWCGNPPVERNQVTITTENRNVSPFCRAIVDTFPSNWEIATPVCALARNDSEYLTNNNL